MRHDARGKNDRERELATDTPVVSAAAYERLSVGVREGSEVFKGASDTSTRKSVRFGTNVRGTNAGCVESGKEMNREGSTSVLIMKPAKNAYRR